MMSGDEMAQAAHAASPEDALAGSLRLVETGPGKASPPLCIKQSVPARSGGVDRLAQLARLIEQDETLAAIVRGGQLEQTVDVSLPQESQPSSHLGREDNALGGHQEGEATSVSGEPGLCDGSTGESSDPSEYDVPDYSNGLPDQGVGSGCWPHSSASRWRALRARSPTGQCPMDAGAVVRLG